MAEDQLNTWETLLKRALDYRPAYDECVAVLRRVFEVR
jgi:hypothetical protein